MLATWHAYAKLRMHTDASLALFETTTSALGQILRHFVQTTCAAFDTQELPREEAARGRRATKARKADPNDKGKARKVGAKRKTLNLFTYKVHALADYV